MKNIKITDYTGDIGALINSEADLHSDACNEKLAYYVDQFFAAGGYTGDVYLNGIGIGRERSVYGMRFRDTGSSYVYERTGALAAISASTDITDDSLLPVQSKMKRCVLNSQSEVVYYLDPQNSMYKLDGTKSAALSVTGVSAPHSEANAWVQINGTADAAHIGSYIRLEDNGGTREHYAMIIGVGEGSDADKYILANPLVIDWGYYVSGGVPGRLCERAYIGDAKLDGSDGQVMVEIPAFYHKHSTETDAAGTWQKHEISLSPFQGARYYPKNYVGATEAVNTDENGKAVEGWTGTWDSLNKKWSGISKAALGKNMASAFGFYPRTTVYRSEVRSKSAAAGGSYHQYGFYDNLSIQLLMITEIAHLNTQSKIGAGISNFTGGSPAIDWSAYNSSNPIRRTGDTVRYGNKSGAMDKLSNIASMKANGEATYIIQSLSYRGIENPYGHVFKWVDGINFEWQANDGAISGAWAWVTDNPSKFSDTLANHIPLPGLIESHAYENGAWVVKSRYWKDPSPEMLPTVISPSNAGYTNDYVSFPAAPAPAMGTLTVLAVGGNAYTAALDGAFYVYANLGSGSRYANVGGRLCSK